MALITCKECGHQISSNAKSCPSCGAKPAKQVGILGIVFAILIGISVFQCTRSGDQAREATAARQAAKTPEQIAREKEESAATEARFQKTVLFVKLLKKSARNPETFKPESVLANDDASLICVEFRAQNGFGGMNKEFAVFAKGKASQEPSAWNKHCANKTLNDMDHVRFALD